MVSFDNDITVFSRGFSSVEGMTCAAHGWAKGAELSLRVLNTRMLKLFILWAPLPNYRKVIRDDLSGRYILICQRCCSACSMAALIPADHRHSGHRPETGGQVFVITDAIHPDPFRPEHRRPWCAISAQSLPRAMDTFIRGARTLCVAAAARRLSRSSCNAVARASAVFHARSTKIRTIKPSLLFCSVVTRMTMRLRPLAPALRSRS